MKLPAPWTQSYSLSPNVQIMISEGSSVTLLDAEGNPWAVLVPAGGYEKLRKP